ncbi:putative glycolipid-binding domain-containing protein [Egicoccus sp. AB-alg2]|uniref:putative glycolipid-binding domain-containing protein n=1 Tax=Egicoccus sp. AB-alg2 TaxID=3242693 RepID=UPI00359DA71D
MNERLLLRPVRDDDGPQLVALIGAAYDEYPGCVLDLPDLDDDLPTPATTAARRGGRWWVLEDDGAVVASVGTGALDDDCRVELKRLYVADSHRRRGLASLLVERVRAHAAGVGATHVVLWSDTRFVDAHRLYERHGFVDTGRRRDLHDPSDTTEIQFEQPVDAPAEARRAWSWDGPFGVEHVRWVDLPDGAVFFGEITDTGEERLGGPLVYSVEVDADWRTRRVLVAGPTGVRVLSSDGAGRWWRDGRPAEELEGCLDVDIEATPLTNTLPIRRAGAGPVTAAWVRVPDPAVEPLHQAYEADGDGRWTYRSAGGFVGGLTVDDQGLVIDYLQQHDDGSTTPIWTRVARDHR